jgi:hypothetical protein
MEPATPKSETNRSLYSPASCTLCGRPSWSEVHELLEMERRHWQRQLDWQSFVFEWDCLRLMLGAE